MLLHAAMPLSFWPDALNTATYLVNRRHCTPRVHASPFLLLFGQHRNTIIFVFSVVDASPTPTRRLRTNSLHVLCLACSSVTRTTPRAIGALIPRLAAFSPRVTSCSMNTSFPSASPHRPRLHPLPHPRFWSNKFPCQCRAVLPPAAISPGDHHAHQPASAPEPDALPAPAPASPIHNSPASPTTADTPPAFPTASPPLPLPLQATL